MGEIAHLFVLVLTFAVTVPTLKCNSDDEYDSVWRERGLATMNASNADFHPNPIEVAREFNKVVRSTPGRSLHEKAGGCGAANPIDACWRCQPDWGQNRMKLAECAMGFGKGTTGGKGGKIYVVNDPSDDVAKPKPGTLRHAVTQKEPLWITFEKDMQIKLIEELLIASDKTIDGRGANVEICNGAQVTIQNVKNVIIHGINIHHISAAKGGLIMDATSTATHHGPSDGDALTVFGSSKIWLDHITMSHAVDGLIDVVQGSTAVTISNCHFTQHDKAVLLGAQDAFTGDKAMQVTVAFNRFGPDITQRIPRVRYGFVHVVNNDYIKWGIYAIGGSCGPTIISEGNRFEASDDPGKKEVTRRDGAPENVWKTWTWKSEGDLLLNGAVFVQSGNPVAVDKNNAIPPKPGNAVPELTRFAGALKCVVNQPC